MANIVKSLGLLALVCSAPSMAQVSHVSINSRMFELGGYPKLRMNVIADNQDMSRLEFVVQQASGEEKLMVEGLNRFLVLLTGVEDVKDDKARLLIREYRLDRWHDVKSISLFDGAKSTSLAKTAIVATGAKTITIATIAESTATVVEPPAKVEAEASLLADKSIIVLNHQSNEPVVPAAAGLNFSDTARGQNPPLAADNTPKATTVKTISVETLAIESIEPKRAEVDNVQTASQALEHCQLTYLAGETLWRTANRYASNWNVSVYGAMLAIYEANSTAFSKNKISALKSNAVLSCPSKIILAKYSNAQEAKALFTTKATEK
ncbi:fimbrial protein FimV [Shewanella morhuae]|uniref:Fimbrial protein FimV n=1 Tax=Shewanella morhuae TaxID=365591 RepID=A0ABX5HQD2_9GAMM|nr:FimV/HubP family polar landmark protein [Shewanella morhuae]PTA49068.1 fimbrial protein FimV [Shewanella morhuae]